jgi:AcrR family transcriptional regulator
MDVGIARQRILRATVELIAEDGYVDASAEGVAARAGVPDEEFQRCFPDLEACVLAVVDDATEEAIGVVRRAATAALDDKPAHDVRQRIERVFEPSLRALLECVAGQPALTRVCVIELATIGARGLAKRDAALERFVRLLEEAIPDLPERPSQLASEMVVGGIHELLQRRARIDDTTELPELAPALAAVWLPVLRGMD